MQGDPETSCAMECPVSKKTPTQLSLLFIWLFEICFLNSILIISIPKTFSFYMLCVLRLDASVTFPCLLLFEAKQSYKGILLSFFKHELNTHTSSCSALKAKTFIFWDGDTHRWFCNIAPCQF